MEVADIIAAAPKAARPLLRFMREEERSPSTIKDYKNTFTRFFDRHDDLSLDSVRQYLEGFNGRTRNKVRSQLTTLALFNEVTIPWHKVAKAKVADEEPIVLSPTQEAALRKYIRAARPDYEWVIVLMLYTGLRIGELLVMQKRDIQNDVKGAPFIKVRKIPGASHSGAGRGIPLYPKAVEALEHVDGPPFKWVSQDMFERYMQGARDVVGEDITPHVLRKTAAAHFAEQGLDVFDLMAVMGWKNAKTATHYVSRSPAAVRKRVKARLGRTSE